jgi:hypothetical protein
VRPDTVRFILRDPHDRLRLEGTPIFKPQERTDVAATRPDQPALRHAGFTASIRLTNLPDADNWTDTLEFYCIDGAGACFRLAPVGAQQRRSWDRAADRFELVLTYTDPQLTTPEQTVGSLDVCDPVANESTVHLTGWAPFDGREAKSVLILQLAPTLAPASIVAAGWLPRPDVQAVVDPDREELARCGFEVLLRIPGLLDAVRKRGALRLWAIHADGSAVRVGLPALR